MIIDTKMDFSNYLLLKINNMDINNINEFLSKTNYRHVYSYRRNLKKKLVEYKGGKCEVCGYDKCITALEFHHINPDEKDFSISSFSSLSYELCKKEVDKCMLLCANCHRELHDKEYMELEKEMIDNEAKIYGEILNNRNNFDIKHVKHSYKYLSNTDIFKDMDNGLTRQEIFDKYHINNRTFNKFLTENNIQYKPKKIALNKPTKDELVELLKNTSKSAIGRMFGVSCGAVIKWCKKYGLQS